MKLLREDTLGPVVIGNPELGGRCSTLGGGSTEVCHQF